MRVELNYEEVMDLLLGYVEEKCDTKFTKVELRVDAYGVEITFRFEE